MDRAEVATTLALEALRQDRPNIAAALAGTIRSAPGVSWVPVATSDRTDPRLRRTLAGHRDWVNDVALGHSAGGELILATASHDTTVGLWRVADGTRFADLRGHTNWASTVAFSPPPQPILASGGWDGTIRLWNPVDGSPIAAFQAHEGPVFDVEWAVLPNGRQILMSGGADDLARIWDPHTRQPLTAPLAGHGCGVRAVAYARTGMRGIVATGSVDGTVRVWDATSGRPLGGVLRGHRMGVLGLAFAPPGRGGGLVLASASLDGTVRLWDVARGLCLQPPLDADAGAVRDVVFQELAGGLRVISAHWDGTVRIWDAASGEAIGEPLRGHEYAATSLSVLTDSSGSWLATAGADDTARVWFLDRDEAAGSASAATGWPVGLALVPSGRDGQPRLLVLQRGAPMRHLTCSGLPIPAPPSGPEAVCAVHVNWPTLMVVTAGADGSLRYLDAQTLQVTVLIPGADDGPVRWLAPARAPEGVAILVAATSDTVTTWDQDGRQLAGRRFPGCDIVALAGGGPAVAVGLGDGRVVTLESDGLAIVGQFRDDQPARALALLPDPWEPRAVVGGRDGSPVVRTPDGAVVATMRGAGPAQGGPILALTSVRLPSGESLLLSAGSDQVLRAWLPDRPTPHVGEFGGFPDAVTAISALVQPDGSVLVGALSGASWVLAELQIPESAAGIAGMIS